jgi:peptidyl-prolyl cis-trans isomerase SurA
MFKTLTATALLALAAFVPLRADIIEQVLVKVNGDIVTKTEFEQRQIAALRQRQDLANVSPDSPELKKAVAEITPDLILSAVDELLLVQRGRELGYALGDEQFATILENIKKENKLETDEQFQAALKQEGLTLLDLRRSLERQMLISRVQQAEVMSKISVTEEEAKAYYEKHRDQFTTPSAITLREVLVEVPRNDSPASPFRASRPTSRMRRRRPTEVSSDRSTARTWRRRCAR